MLKDPTRPELTDAERILLGYLHRHCRGAAYARTYARLRQDLGAAGVKIGEREMYELVSSLVNKGRPVGTISAHGGGAFIVMDARDARLAYRNLYGRVCRQARRCRRFRQTVSEGLTHQRYLDLADAERAYQTAVDGRSVDAAVQSAVKDRTSAVDQGLLFRNPAPGSMD